MASSRIISLFFLTGLSVSCLDQYKPFAFWEKIESERQMSRNPSMIVASDGSKITLGEDGKLVIMASDAPAHDPATDTPEQIYTQVCAVCHGKSGEGVANNPARIFTDLEWQNESTDEDMAYIIRVGTLALMNPSDSEKTEFVNKMKARKTFKPYTGGMAASGGRASAPLTDEQIDGLVKIIRSFK